MTDVDEVSLRIEAAPEKVWDLLADITRMPEWSPDLWRCSWRGKVREPVAGARFIGFNKTGFPTPNVIESAERGREFSFRTTAHDTVWRYLPTPDGDGWKGKLGRAMVYVGEEYWVGGQDDEEWAAGDAASVPLAAAIDGDLKVSRTTCHPEKAGRGEHTNDITCVCNSVDYCDLRILGMSLAQAE